MSEFTTQVRYICEMASGIKEHKSFDDVDQIIDLAANNIMPNYPIYNETYRSVLNHKILEHYYTREIGFETVGLWRLKLKTKLNEIMPYYNQLYKSAEIEYDPLGDTDITTTRDDTFGGTSGNSGTVSDQGGTTSHIEGISEGESDGTTNTHRLNQFSDTPQSGLENFFTQGTDTNIYLTNATMDDQDTDDHRDTSSSSSSTGNTTNNNTRTTNLTGTTNTTDHWIEVIKGKRGIKGFSELLKEYREVLINIDMMIIEELNELFMNIYE